MQRAGKLSRGIAPTLPTQASPSQLESVRRYLPTVYVSKHSPNTGCQIDLLKQRELPHERLSFGIRDFPPAAAVHPWRRVVWGTGLASLCARGTRARIACIRGGIGSLFVRRQLAHTCLLAVLCLGKWTVVSSRSQIMRTRTARAARYRSISCT
jgi:hypothetical protein